MERRDFLKIAFGLAAGAIVTARAAQAMTPPPSPLTNEPATDMAANPAVATPEDVEGAKVEKIQWRHRRYRRWRRRRWYRHHHWHRRRHWGWHRRHWRHRHWRRRYYW